MAEDLSRKTIVALVLLTVIISILGTWIVLEEVNNIQIQQQPPRLTTTSSSQGEVSLEVIGPKEKPPASLSTGKVTLEILK